MGSPFHRAHGFAACSGSGVVAAIPRGDPARVRLAVATLMGEREARGVQDGILLLRVADPGSAGQGARAAVRWGAEHGFRVVLRLAVTVDPQVVDACRAAAATVLLELAHPDPQVQAALLDAPGSTASGLLLQAQHFESMGVPVGAVVGPLLPGLHDREGEMRSLWRHAVAADVRQVQLAVSPLDAGRLRRLTTVLGHGGLVGLARAFGFDPSAPGDGPWRAPLSAVRSLQALMHREARRAGLCTEGCGCPAMCRLDRVARPRRRASVLGPDLFASG